MTRGEVGTGENQPSNEHTLLDLGKEEGGVAGEGKLVTRNMNSERKSKKVKNEALIC